MVTRTGIATLVLASCHGLACRPVCLEESFTLHGRERGDFFGVAISGGGDVNGDGCPDFVVGAYNYVLSDPRLSGGGPVAGYAQVFSGLDGSILHTWEHTARSWGFGMAVAIVGDADLDGFAEVAVGAPYARLQEPSTEDKPTTSAGPPSLRTGRVYIYSGRSGILIKALEGLSPSFGQAISGVSDIDGDGRDDLIIGAPLGSEGKGEVFVYGGGHWNLIRKLVGAVGKFGAAIASPGDMDGDGVFDIIVGAASFGVALKDRGAAFVYSGRTSVLMHSWEGREAFTGLGSSVAGIGDVDGDGVPDVLVGAAGLDVSRDERNAGGAFVFSSATGEQLLRIVGPRPGAEFGIAICSLGDLDGDGSDDFAVSTLREGFDPPKPGMVRGYSGCNGGLLFEVPGRDMAVVAKSCLDMPLTLVTSSWSDPTSFKDTSGVVRGFHATGCGIAVSQGR